MPSCNYLENASGKSLSNPFLIFFLEFLRRFLQRFHQKFLQDFFSKSFRDSFSNSFKFSSKIIIQGITRIASENAADIYPEISPRNSLEIPSETLSVFFLIFQKVRYSSRFSFGNFIKYYTRHEFHRGFLQYTFKRFIHFFSKFLQRFLCKIAQH